MTRPDLATAAVEVLRVAAETVGPTRELVDLGVERAARGNGLVARVSLTYAYPGADPARVLRDALAVRLDVCEVLLGGGTVIAYVALPTHEGVPA